MYICSHSCCLELLQCLVFLSVLQLFYNAYGGLVISFKTFSGNRRIQNRKRYYTLNVVALVLACILTRHMNFFPKSRKKRASISLSLSLYLSRLAVNRKSKNLVVSQFQEAVCLSWSSECIFQKSKEVGPNTSEGKDLLTR